MVARDGVEPPTPAFSGCSLEDLRDFRRPPKYLRRRERHVNRGWKSWVQNVRSEEYFGQLCEVWLRLFANIDANERTQDSLLRVHWLRWLAKTWRPGLRQRPLRPTRAPGSDRLGRSDPTAGRAGSDTAGTRSSAEAFSRQIPCPFITPYPP